MYMSLRACPGFGIWLTKARCRRTPPQINSDSPVIKTTRRSDRPPLFSMSIRCRLRTQFMSCTAELSSCLRRTPRASRHRAVPTPSRHSLDTLVVVERRPTPPRPQPRIKRSLNHHSSTCSSRMLFLASSCPLKLTKGRQILLKDNKSYPSISVFHVFPDDWTSERSRLISKKIL
uniref:Uncharacterized protein n=1 Tax=Oryzias sinensis TaxID=183150 RepID=A0A8C7ZW80_9TELE